MLPFSVALTLSLLLMDTVADLSAEEPELAVAFKVTVPLFLLIVALVDVSHV